MSEENEQKQRQLESLNQQLEQVKSLASRPTSGTKRSGDAARAAIDFASATAVGSLLGFGFDRWQGTLPWGLLVGLLIGTAAGVKLMFDEEARQKRRAEKSNETTNDEQPRT